MVCSARHIEVAVVTEGSMKSLRSALVGAAMVCAVAAPASAQSLSPESNTLTERNVYLFTMTGEMIHMRVSDATHAMMMRHFKPMAAGTMIYVSGGRVYMARDRRMAGGK